MIRFFKSIFSKEAVDENIKKVLFNIVTLGGIIGGSIAILISLFIKLPSVQIVAIAFALAVLILGLYLANKKDMVNLGAFLIVSVITLVLFPVMFYTDGGLYGGMGYWFVIGIIFNFLLVEGRLCIVVLVLQVITTITCFTDAYFNPHHIIMLDSTGDVFVDTVQSLLVVSIVIGIIVKFQNKVYIQKLEELDQSEKKAMAAAQEAMAAGKAKSVFLAQMSHEIRTPINAVLGMNEMILRESKEKDIIDYAVSIDQAGHNLLTIINSILDFSKIEDGKMEIVPVKYDTALFINKLVNYVLLRAREKGLEFIVDVDENLPVSLMGDDMRLSQVIENLLTNAVKYTEKGFIKLTIITEKKEGDTISIFVSVKDSGIGIRPEDRDRLFESFERLDETRNRHIEGTGLGISIVTKLLEIMGSRINVESTYGKGSEFYFSIEQKIIDGTPMGDYKKRAAEESRTSKRADIITAPGARILVVDDNETNLKVVKNLLRLCSIRPDMVSSGDETIEIMAKKVYDIVLLDHMMPRMDGVETLNELKKRSLIPSATRIIALTANAVAGAKEKYLAAGFDDYLSKPIDIENLMVMLKAYLPDEAFKETPQDEPEVFEFLPEDITDDTDVKFDIQKLKEAGLDTDAGLRYCAGDESVYFDIVNDYMMEYDNKHATLDEAYARKNWRDYQVSVHALKSTSKTVGSELMYEAARALEEAARSEDTAFIEANHERTMTSYKRIVDEIISAGDQS